MDTLKESLNSHPSTAMQAKAFTSPASLSFPGGAGDLTPPTEAKDLNAPFNGANGQANGQHNSQLAMPATPVATPAAGQGQGVSGIVPTLQ
jgi:transcription initiation factor TFIID TATA-box-binding protein